MTVAQTSGVFPLFPLFPLHPDPSLAIEKYRHHAHGYDASAQRTMPLRRRVAALLRLAPGDTVLDVACGTGLSLPLLREAVGPSGRVIGIEVSPEMIALSRERVAAAGWDNVSLIQAPMEDADPGVPLDAILFNYTHDVLQSPPALERIFARARPRARVAVAGIKHPSRWLFPLRIYRILKATPYVTTLRGLDAPWRLLQGYVPDLRIEPVLFGTNYLARGTAHPAALPA
ncbi:MAG: class I SAM-dependent methyltransferase [Betaproteobacteria bacterium]